MTKMLKLLADVNIEKLIIDNLMERGYDIKGVININKHLIDEEILNLANSEKRVIITNDKDFGEIVYRQKLISSGIILLRLPDLTDQVKWDIIANVFSKDLIKVGNFIVITKDKIRVSPLGVLKWK